MGQKASSRSIRFLLNNSAIVGISMSMVLIFAFVTLFLRDFLKVSHFKVGLVIGLSHLVSIALSPVVGAMSDATQTSWGRRRPFLLLGAFLSALMIVLMPFIRSYYLFLLVVSIFFIFSIVQQIPFYALIPEVAPSGQRGIYTVYIGLLRLLGLALMMGLGSILWRFSFYYTFYLAAFFVVFSSLISVFSVREDNNFLPRRQAGPALSWDSRVRAYLKDLLEQRKVLVFFIAQAWWWVGLGAVIPFATILLKEFYRFDITQLVRFSPLALGLALLLVLFVVLAGVLGDRWGHWQVITLGLAILSLASVIAYFARSPGALLLVGIAVIISGATLFTEPLAFLAELIPRGREGEFYGLDTISITLSQVPAAVAGGAVIDWLGHAAIFLVAASGLILSLIFMLVERRI